MAGIDVKHQGNWPVKKFRPTSLQHNALRIMKRGNDGDVRAPCGLGLCRSAPLHADTAVVYAAASSAPPGVLLYGAGLARGSYHCNWLCYRVQRPV